MAKQRYINTKFWSDNFIVGLDPIDRYLFLYFLTNEHTNICGVYELPLRTLLFETGLRDKQLTDSLGKLKGKIGYEDGWVYIRNFAKHQKANDSITKGVDRSLQELPSDVLAKYRQLQGASPQSVPSEIQSVSLEIQPPPSLGTDCHLSESELESESELRLESPGGQGVSLEGNKKPEKQPNPHRTIEWIRNIPDEEVKKIAEDEEVTEAFVRLKAKSVIGHCEAHGKTYKNYRSALGNYIRDDIEKHPDQRRRKPAPEEVARQAELNRPRTPEEQARIDAQLAELRKQRERLAQGKSMSTV